MKVISGGITAPKGFLAGAARAGFKKKGDDTILIFSEAPAVAGGLFTSNQFQAAPVLVSRKHLREGVLARAIIANSGNANSCTGQRGYKDAIAMANMAAKSLGKKADIKPEDVLVASTGHIGRFLDVSKIKKAMPALIRGLSGTGSERAAKAIMTTDTKPKQVSVKVKIGSSDVVIGGIAKGAGMIHPNLATMLCFITTDAYITRRGLRLALQTAAETSFNAISVDGDMSTNDSVMALANGLAKNSLIDKAGKDFAVFSQALGFVCLELAKMIVKDGEGASKFVEIHIKNAPDIRRAVRAGKAVAASNLLKTCVYGGDPNWGRIISALGASSMKIRPERVAIHIGSKVVARNGMSLGVRKEDIKDAFRRKDIKITIDLNMGRKSASVYTCDLTEKYVKFNALYET